MNRQDKHVQDKYRKFSESARRHGLLRTITRYVYGKCRRIVDFEVCRVGSDNGPHDWPHAPKGYQTIRVNQQEFNHMLCDELKGVDYDWAFARGDHCIVNIHDGQIVGYSFSTLQPTRVKDGLVFRFPKGFMYGFAGMTAASHRGKKLQRERWKVRKSEYVREYGSVVRAIWYINVTNLESLAAVEHSGLNYTSHGYAGYVRCFGRWLTFSSPGCKRLGAGFASDPG